MVAPAPAPEAAGDGASLDVDAWLAGRPLEDATLAAYVAEFYDQGRAPASAATAVAAACFRARLAGEPNPAGERPGNGRPGFWPATGGPPAIAAAARRGRSGPRTSPPSSPPTTARGAAGAASSPTPSPASAAA